MIKNYFADRPEIDYPQFRTLIEDVSLRFPDNTAFRMRNGGDSFDELTYADVYRRVRTIAAFLLQSGVGRGERVGLISENRFEWVLTYLATVYAGIVVVPFDIHTTTEGLGTFAAFADLSVLFYSAKYAMAAEKMIESSQRCSFNICFDRVPKDELPRNAAYFFDIVGDEDLLFKETDLPDIEPNDPASIIFTSGTTGSPKGVTLSHHGIIANVNASIMSLPIDEHDNFVAVLPFHHTYPTTCSFISPYTIGGSVTIVDKIAGPRIIADIRDTEGTILIGVPLLFDKLKKGIASRLSQLPSPVRTILNLFRMLARAGAALHIPLAKVLFSSFRSKAGLSSVRLLVSGGGPLSASTAAFFQELGFKIVQGYGMSENGPLITTNTEKYYDNNSTGLAVKYTRIRIADPDRFGVGEIEVHSPSLMLGYFRNPEATSEVFTGDGFLKTGDLGYINEKGFLFISGRSKNMIVTAGGKNVFPEEIETLFPEDSPIAEVLIMGQDAGDSKGERVIAVCVPDYEGLKQKNGGVLPSDEEIETQVNETVRQINRNLESHKKILKVYIRSEGFEKTASDKVKRFLYSEYSRP